MNQIAVVEPSDDAGAAGLVSISAGRLSEGVIDSAIAEGMFRLRHDVLSVQLGWDVDSSGDLERDAYDDLDPVYVIVADAEADEVVGCIRLLATCGPYMLRDTFREALCGDPPPRDVGVWEASRFVTAPASRLAGRGGGLAGSVGQLVLGAAGHALAHIGAHSCVALTGVTVEQRFRARGLALRRVGTGQPVLIGSVMCVAVRFSVASLLPWAPLLTGSRP